MATARTDEYVALAALLAVLVGFLRVAVWFVKAGEIAFLLSVPVLAGFTFAAAVVIALSQAPDLVGAAVAQGPIPIEAWNALTSPGSWHAETVLLGLSTIAVMLVAPRIHPLIPGVLIAVVGGVIYSTLADFSGDVVGAIFAQWPLPSCLSRGRRCRAWSCLH